MELAHRWSRLASPNTVPYVERRADGAPNSLSTMDGELGALLGRPSPSRRRASSPKTPTMVRGCNPNTVYANHGVVVGSPATAASNTPSVVSAVGHVSVTTLSTKLPTARF